MLVNAKYPRNQRNRVGEESAGGRRGEYASKASLRMWSPCRRRTRQADRTASVKALRWDCFGHVQQEEGLIDVDNVSVIRAQEV